MTELNVECPQWHQSMANGSTYNINSIVFPQQCLQLVDNIYFSLIGNRNGQTIDTMAFDNTRQVFVDCFLEKQQQLGLFSKLENIYIDVYVEESFLILFNEIWDKLVDPMSNPHSQQLKTLGM